MRQHNIDVIQGGRHVNGVAGGHCMASTSANIVVQCRHRAPFCQLKYGAYLFFNMWGSVSYKV